MAPVETHTALLHRGGFDEESRKYPIFAFLEKYIEWFDDRNHDEAAIQDFHTADFQVHTSHSVLIESTDEGHAFGGPVSKFYTDPLRDHKQFPQIFTAIELSSGWEIFCRTTMYADVVGDGVEGEKKVVDPEGREWQLEIKVHYEAELIKDPTAKYFGLRFTRIDFVKDSSLINEKLDERGISHKRISS